MPEAGGYTPMTPPRGLGGAPGGRGFTLLETVVALTIFAAAGAALYGLFNANLIALTRAQDISEQTPVVRYAMERLAGINPWEQTAGQFEMEDFEITWTARLLEPVRQGQTGAGLRGYFDLGLYEAEFEITRSGRSLGTWRLRLVGYRKARGQAPGGGRF